MTAYLVFGYDLGDPGSVKWAREQAARFGEERLKDCGEAFDWLLQEGAYRDLPDTVARKVLQAWYTPEDIENVVYPWGHLQEKKLLTVERVGWCEDHRLVLASYPILETRDDLLVKEVHDLFVSDAVRRTLTQAYRALGLASPEEDHAPRWLLADVSSY